VKTLELELNEAVVEVKVLGEFGEFNELLQM
jgi:hypothetical protein